MKISSWKFKIGILGVILFVVVSAFFWFREEREINLFLKQANVSMSANTVTTQSRLPSRNALLTPIGINNPFEYPKIDANGYNCLNVNDLSSTSLELNRSYSETHINANSLTNCLPVATEYMNNIKDIGMNVVSQHFPRRYDEKGIPYFGIDEKKHKNHEVAVQMYSNLFENYLWLAINPVSEKGFIGDIDIETHKIINKDDISKKFKYLPASEAGFIEWQRWLNAVFDYLKDHNALDKLAYIQIGNESDGDYVKQEKGRDREDENSFYWQAYAKLIEKSYDIIKSKSPNTKIAIGAMAGGSVTVDGFQKPVLEYLNGKRTSETEGLENTDRKCGGTGCFDVYDYHDFAGYKEYKGRKACQPRDCVNPTIVVEKTPENMNKLLRETGFSDKKLVIQQSGTYTGQDSKINNTKEYQSEEDQASYLVKKAIYSLANGVDQIQYVTYIEHSCYDDTIHNWFTMMGFVYNGMPDKENSYCNKDGKKIKLANCDGQLPCPDPGAGVKKLSYFSIKKLIEILSGFNAKKIEPIAMVASNVSLYKLTENGKTIYFAWWDWWNKCPRPDSLKPKMNESCIERNGPTVSINVEDIGNTAKSVRVTEIVPDFNFNIGGKIDSDVLKSVNENIQYGIVSVRLGTKPVYIELVL